MDEVSWLIGTFAAYCLMMIVRNNAGSERNLFDGDFEPCGPPPGMGNQKRQKMDAIALIEAERFISENFRAAE